MVVYYRVPGKSGWEVEVGDIQNTHLEALHLQMFGIEKLLLFVFVLKTNEFW